MGFSQREKLHTSVCGSGAQRAHVSPRKASSHFCHSHKSEWPWPSVFSFLYISSVQVLRCSACRACAKDPTLSFFFAEQREGACERKSACPLRAPVGLSL